MIEAKYVYVTDSDDSFHEFVIDLSRSDTSPLDAIREHYWAFGRERDEDQYAETAHVDAWLVTYDGWHACELESLRPTKKPTRIKVTDQAAWVLMGVIRALAET